MNSLKKILEDAGFFQYGIVDTKKLHFSQEVRGKHLSPVRKNLSLPACNRNCGGMPEAYSEV